MMSGIIGLIISSAVGVWRYQVVNKHGGKMPWLWANSNGFLGRKTEPQGPWDAAPMVYAQLQGQREFAFPAAGPWPISECHPKWPFSVAL